MCVCGLSASSHASRVGETGLATGGVQGQMSGASADFPQSGQHGQVAVSASSLPSSTAQPATAVPGNALCRESCKPDIGHKSLVRRYTAPNAKGLSILEQAAYFHCAISNQGMGCIPQYSTVVMPCYCTNIKLLLQYIT